VIAAAVGLVVLVLVMAMVLVMGIMVILEGGWRVEEGGAGGVDLTEGGM